MPLSRTGASNVNGRVVREEDTFRDSTEVIGGLEHCSYLQVIKSDRGCERHPRERAITIWQFEWRRKRKHCIIVFLSLMKWQWLVWNEAEGLFYISDDIFRVHSAK